MPIDCNMLEGNEGEGDGETEVAIRVASTDESDGMEKVNSRRPSVEPNRLLFGETSMVAERFRRFRASRRRRSKGAKFV